MQVNQTEPMGSTLESDDLDSFDSLATEMTLAAKELLIGDRDVLAQHTQAVLSELGLSYRDQEHHTGVNASIVFAMANGKPCHLFGVQRFAAFAVHRARGADAREYWQRLMNRLDRDERRRLTHAAGEARSERPAPSSAPSSTSGPATVSPDEVASLYSALILPQNRNAVVQLIRALSAAESVNFLSTVLA